MMDRADSAVGKSFGVQSRGIQCGPIALEVDFALLAIAVSLEMARHFRTSSRPNSQTDSAFSTALRAAGLLPLWKPSPLSASE